MSESKNPKLLVVHLGIGLDLIGSKTSLHNNKYDIEATQIGVLAKSRTSGRSILIPWTNIKGAELMPETGIVSKAPAQARADQALAEARADMAKRGQKVVPAPYVLTEAEQAEMAQTARTEARKAAKIAAAKALEQEQAKG